MLINLRDEYLIGVANETLLTTPALRREAASGGSAKAKKVVTDRLLRVSAPDAQSFSRASVPTPFGGG
jgi:hypothetical protein